MKKAVLLGAAMAIAFAFALLMGDSASARPPFKKVWDEVYLTEGSKIRESVGEKGSCNVCHAGTKSKKNRNAYGMALSELIGKNDVEDTEKIKEAFETVNAMHTVADDDTSPTYAAQIEEGTLPLTTEEP
jgi:hypothetical protein